MGVIISTLFVSGRGPGVWGDVDRRKGHLSIKVAVAILAQDSLISCPVSFFTSPSRPKSAHNFTCTQILAILYRSTEKMFLVLRFVPARLLLVVHVVRWRGWLELVPAPVATAVQG